MSVIHIYIYVQCEDDKHHRTLYTYSAVDQVTKYTGKIALYIDNV